MLPYIFEFFFAQRVGKTVVSRFHRKRGELQLFNAPILIAARAPRCVPQRVPPSPPKAQSPAFYRVRTPTAADNNTNISPRPLYDS